MFVAAMALATLAIDPAFAQYPGQVTKKPDNTPQLRAIAVIEWTGDAGKPKASRLVPVTIYDGERLNDAGLYLARPEPLALSGEVEYQLKDDGKTIGLFDIKNTGQEQGSWVGYGEWKPVERPTPPAPPKPIDDPGDDDKPVLHRKKHADDTAASAKPDSGTATPPSAPDDPDRPKLHKKDQSATSAPAADPDRPTLHKDPTPSPDASAGDAPVDPDRPVMKKPKAKAAEDVSRSESLPDVTDPDRPRLMRGRSNADNLKVEPSLMGLPPDMQQAVAVSDAQNRPDHPWNFNWASPGDEDKMKAALEGMARSALALDAPPPAPASKPSTHHSSGAKKPAPLPPPPAPLQDETFRAFELTYGSGATLVLTADTGGPLAQEKFVTIVAQPDIYGNLQVVLKNVTNGAHLDDTPHMRLVDAVDALADNRGELLFELRGQTSRQFALFRILRGRAEKLFVSGGGEYGSTGTE